MSVYYCPSLLLWAMNCHSHWKRAQPRFQVLRLHMQGCTLSKRALACAADNSQPLLLFALGPSSYRPRYLALSGDLSEYMGTCPWTQAMPQQMCWQIRWLVPPLLSSRTATHLSTAHAPLPSQLFLLPWLSAVVWGYFGPSFFFFLHKSAYNTMVTESCFHLFSFHFEFGI